MRRFKIDTKEVGRAVSVIKGADANHMINVLRLKPGDSVGLFDENGMEYDARIETMGHGKVQLAAGPGRRCRAESPVRITVAQGYLKDKKMDTLIRQLTELGISRWIPFFAARSIPRPDADRLSKRYARWQKIAAESLKQCRRAISPLIETAVGFEPMLQLAGQADVRIAFWEEERTAIADARGFRDAVSREVFIILGPEGGLTGEEITLAQQAGFQPLSLGPRILRAETATLAACTLVQYLFGDLGKGGL